MLVDERKVKNNVQKMLAKAVKSKAHLRPHFKTHHSSDVASWMREEGITKATVSSVDMARYFANAGWQDLTIAFPYNPREAEAIEALAKKITLNLTMVSKDALDHLNRHVDAPLNYFIKVDVGTHRTGVLPDQVELIKALSCPTHSAHQLKGLMAHAGHSYQPMTVSRASEIFNHSLQSLESVRDQIGQKNLVLSYGDTPTCSLLEKFHGLDELRPGNFAFYDTMQTYFGSCQLENIAVCVACPVVAIHKDRQEVVVYGGAVHLSKDFITVDGRKNYGTVVPLLESGWETSPIGHVDRLSQEHGIIKVSNPFLHELSVGDLLGVLPVHSCLTADLQGYYVSLTDQKITKFNKADL